MFESLSAQPRPLWPLLIVIALIATEYLWQRRRGLDAYDWRESLSSTVIAIGGRMIRSLNALLVLPLVLWIAQYRVFDWHIDSSAEFIGVILIVDFVYYWMHRAMHRVRWFWASHAVHHSSTHLNLSAAYRLGWTELLSGTWLFLLPLAWLGIPPLAVFAAFALNLGYQFFMHTEFSGRLPGFDFVFNAPRHHRVHHAHNPGCVDRNFGGVLMVWDRLFGTFAEAPQEKLQYGLLGAAPSHNPLRIAFGEWQRLFADMRAAGDLRRAVGIAFGRP
jgi:sterol desaturase/sphingolipid hydroxylase (fatty acid hydroxylase superfamily)